jgi:hypothetical protein
MFEVELSSMTADVHFDDREIALFDRMGVGIFVRGFNTFDHATALAVVRKAQRILPSVPKYELRRYKAIIGGIINAFGPEFAEEVK